MPQRLKSALRAITPYGLVQLRRSCLRAAQEAPAQSARDLLHVQRRERIDQILQSGSSGAPKLNGENYDSIVGFLADLGLSRSAIVGGSMPGASLSYACSQIQQHLSCQEPYIGIHIGNFVGVSLAYLAAFLVRMNAESIVISIDPNLPHRGIDNPQSYVMRLLVACGLQRNVMVIAGYSSDKSISNDGVVFSGYDPVENYPSEQACEMILENLAHLFHARCSVAMIDGNHEAEYLRSEIRQLGPLMKPGSLLVLDDVDTNWPEIKGTFESLDDLGVETLGTDGRVGIATMKGTGAL